MEKVEDPLFIKMTLRLIKMESLFALLDTCETPYSDAKYGRTVHLVMKNNPRLFNNPPRSSKEWKLEYNARTSAERSNKREKLDFKLEDGRHRSTKMWYCRLYHILMLQHLDAWDLPFESPLKKLILDAA